MTRNTQSARLIAIVSVTLVTKIIVGLCKLPVLAMQYLSRRSYSQNNPGTKEFRQ